MLSLALVGSAGLVELAPCSRPIWQSYQDYHCADMNDPETGAPISAAELECEVDPEMVEIATTSAGW